MSRWWFIAMLPPRVPKPRSSTESVRRLRLTFARIGRRFGSKAYSTIESSVSRTGTTRSGLQTKMTSGPGIGRISTVPA